MCNPVNGMVTMVNNSFDAQRNLMLVIRTCDMAGKDSLLTQVFTYIEPSSVKKILSVKEALNKLGNEKGVFLSLQLVNENKQVVSDNFYWFPDSTGNYSGLQSMAKANLSVKAREIAKGKIEVVLTNPANNPVAFFNRVSLLNSKTKERILPAFYSDNYCSVLPGREKKITIAYEASGHDQPMVAVEGWNVTAQMTTLSK
jgi:hypothetical protein